MDMQQPPKPMRTTRPRTECVSSNNRYRPASHVSKPPLRKRAARRRSEPSVPPSAQWPSRPPSSSPPSPRPPKPAGHSDGNRPYRSTRRVAHLERVGFPPELARKIVEIAIGTSTEPVTKAELTDAVSSLPPCPARPSCQPPVAQSRFPHDLIALVEQGHDIEPFLDEIDQTLRQSVCESGRHPPAVGIDPSLREPKSPLLGTCRDERE